MNVKTIYIQTIPSQKMALVKEDNEIIQATFLKPNQSFSVGNIYLGRVRRIDHSLQSAFIDVGSKKLGFLPKKELPLSRKFADKSIENLIHEGMAIFVQVTKEAYDSKGPRLTANITIPGQFLIYLPYGRYIALSKKIEGDKRKELETLLSGWIQDEEGVILRTSSSVVSYEQLKEEWESMKSSWNTIFENSSSLKPPLPVMEDQDIPDRFLRKFAVKGIDEIIFDEQEVSQQMKSKFPHLSSKMRWSSPFVMELPISNNQLIESLTSRTVKLQSGIELVIEKVEAFTIIDVNTANFKGKFTKEQTILHTNMQAAREIAKQLRLRNIGGIILIDFIDMHQSRDESLLINEMKKVLKKDPTFTEVHGFTKLGIMEITRKREGLDSFSLFTTNMGREFSSVTSAYELERELLQYQHKDVEAFLIEANEDIIDQFRQHVNTERLKERLKIPVYVEKKTLEHRKYVIKFIGDLKWLTGSELRSKAIDKLF
jgi:ribonuclease G